MAYTPHGMARVTCVRPSAAGVSVAGACRGVDGCHVLCLLLGARSSRGQCLSGSSGGSAEVWIDYPATGEGNCGLTGGDFHIRLWCQHWSLNLGFNLERTRLTTGKPP